MKIICRGAESIIYLGEFQGQEAIIKERIRKGYRIDQIDKKLRKSRTKKEIRLLTEARKVGVPTPKILDIDDTDYKIVMENITGQRVKEFLNSDAGSKDEVCCEIGRMIGKLHSSGIVHGDLTTSNMILKDDKVYFIDFGLGEFSKKIEDKGVDMNLLFEALKSTHFKILKHCWDCILKGYRKEYKDADEVLEKVSEIEKRARYSER